MMRLGLLGFPLEHSLSPVLHEAALQTAGLQGSYSLHPVRPGNTGALGNLVNCVRSGELTGLNVTIPHKQAVLPLLDVLTPSAERIGAVNTIYSRGRQVIGDNTDAPGFLADLERFAPGPASALVLGAGGAAAAVAYALWASNCRVTLAARRVEEAGQLARRFPGTKVVSMDVEELARTDAEVIVNATPVGMFPNVDENAWPDHLPFPVGAAIYDLVYNPAETRLVRTARAAGLRAITGLGMLVEQAVLAFEIWTGYTVPRAVLLRALTQGTL